MDQGYLKIILGCMYAGKTSKLINIYKMMKFSNIETMVINYEEDTRYHSTHLSTHDKVMIPCVKAGKLMDLKNTENIDKVKVFIINEGQFFEDLYIFVKEMLDKEKHIYVCGLDGDYKMNKFGQMLDIIPLSNEIEKLSAICSICKNGTKAYFTKRITNEEGQKVIGSDNYLPVCRKCHKKK
jgi:thymidine kinase